ncbi:hypothetical protein G4G28_10725 [Massilia sp. Dwa41.01b]|uniref:hypothetical protein n=1 Tax=Massilia sp. Dwa41.01b TaxID=2709302 RepID=UPI0015FF1E1A|nr:hypothetical protein [Massilia sp. Dwa41.01b]QNA88841.1 hypothetical protein G4G28_10725 [Massilia sp. Dwa41.01b]
MARTAVEAQARTGEQGDFARAIGRHAAQFQLQQLAPAGRARVETAHMQVGTDRTCGAADRAARQDGRCLDDRGGSGDVPGFAIDRADLARRCRCGRRLRVAVRASAVPGHDPEGAVRMIGIAATVHGRRGRGSSVCLAEHTPIRPAVAPAWARRTVFS